MWSHYFHTLRYLRPAQITGRLMYRLSHPRPDLRPAPARRALTGLWIAPCSRPASLLALEEACFLNRRLRLDFPRGWNDPSIEKLWLYNLHYFAGLLAAGDGTQQALRRAWIQRWLQDNPPGHGTGWEPYPLSLRIVNWIKWLLAGEPANPEILHSIAVQVRYLRERLERHLLGNHLFENAKALVFAGSFFGGAEAERWRHQGEEILREQLREQLLADGGHFERSPMYHSLSLEGLLDLCNLDQAFRHANQSQWEEPSRRMFAWLGRMCHPDGGLAFFNDAAFGIAPTLAELQDYAHRLNLLVPPEVPNENWLGASGYARLTRDGFVVLADVAPIGPDYLPAHAHADTLSFECSIARRRVLVNAGTSVYGISDERQRQRGTAAHNTLRIDGKDSSEVWAGFRVARRATPYVERFEDKPVPLLQAWHDGYRRLHGRPLHRRRWTLRDGALEIMDEVLGRKQHEIEVFFHFHPELILLPQGTHAFAVRDVNGAAVASVEADPALVWQIVQETWHPGFGLSMPSVGLRGYGQLALPGRCVTFIRRDG